MKTIAQNSHPLHPAPDIPYQSLYNTMTERGFNNAYIAMEFDLILTKIIEDKYVSVRVGKVKSADKDGEWTSFDERYYSITFEGIILLDSGGYVGLNEERKTLSNVQHSLHLLQQQQTKMQRWIAILTFVLAITSIPAAVYYLLEILTFLAEPFYRFH